MTSVDTLPIFPLGTVLFPDGVLALRVFEARYLDMISECMRRDAPFGVCLITRGGEVGEPAEHESTGCEARIIDWDAENTGVLLIRARGGSRFRVIGRRLQPDRQPVGLQPQYRHAAWHPGLPGGRDRPFGQETDPPFGIWSRSAPAYLVKRSMAARPSATVRRVSTDWNPASRAISP